MKIKSLLFILIMVVVSVILSFSRYPVFTLLNYLCVVLVANAVFQREKDIMNAVFVGSMLTAAVRIVFLFHMFFKQGILDLYHITSVLESVLSLISIVLILTCFLSRLLINFKKNRMKKKRSKNEVV